MADIIFTSSDDFYKRLHDLADTVNREIAERQKNSLKGPLSTSLPSPISTENLINEEEVSEREAAEREDEMAAKIKRAITKMKRLDSRLAELAKVRFCRCFFVDSLIRRREILRDRGSHLKAPMENQIVLIVMSYRHCLKHSHKKKVSLFFISFVITIEFFMNF